MSRGLSCYTANLYAYLVSELDAAALIARSVRLAVRVESGDGLLAFSHHAPSLDHLPDGTWLRYAAAADAPAALPAVGEELAAHGRVLVVVDAARLGWSVLRGGRPAPHWLLVDGRDGARWHVVDLFTALLPTGEQGPHSGWLSAAELRDAMSLPGSWTPEQELRNALAFGDRVAVPDGGALWLHRCRDRPGPRDGTADGWLCEDARTLPFLADYLVERGVGAAPHLDDLWAAAGHRSFAHRQLIGACSDPARKEALGSACARWEDLPRVLRFALESAHRGRPRARLIRATLEALLRVEEDLA